MGIVIDCNAWGGGPPSEVYTQSILAQRVPWLWSCSVVHFWGVKHVHLFSPGRSYSAAWIPSSTLIIRSGPNWKAHEQTRLISGAVAEMDGGTWTHPSVGTLLLNREPAVWLEVRVVNLTTSPRHGRILLCTPGFKLLELHMQLGLSSISLPDTVNKTPRVQAVISSSKIR